MEDAFTGLPGTSLAANDGTAHAAHTEQPAGDAAAPQANRKELEHLLPSERLLLGELLDEDSLCISAAGLGWHKVVAALLRMHAGASAAQQSADMAQSSTSQQGVGTLLLLGALPWQRALIAAELARQDPNAVAPAEITNEVPALERVERYRSGAACFVTTRILVVDLLSARVLPRNVAGMVVLNAHRVTETSGEGFALRLFRQGSSRGFVRAFSDMPTAFGAGFNKVEKTMKALYVRRLVLWPRFQQYVQDDLESVPPQLSEWEQDPTDAMLSVHEGLVELVQALLKELQRTNRLDCSDLNPEEGLHRPFDRIVRQQLDPIWNTLSWKARQAVRDMGTVQALAGHLLRHDAVTFLSYLEDLRASEGARSVWLFHDVTHAIYATARKRVYLLHAGGDDAGDKAGPKKGSSRKRKARGPPQEADDTADAAAGSSKSQRVRVEPVLEQPPKWGLLRQVLEEIQSKRAAALKLDPGAAAPDPAIKVEDGPVAGSTAAEASSVQHATLAPQQQQQQQQEDGEGKEVDADVVDLVSDSDPEEVPLQQQAQAARQQQEPLPVTRSGVLALQEASSRPVLVVVRELHLVEQLERVIREGGTTVMHRLYDQYLLSKVQDGGARRGGKGRGRSQGASSSAHGTEAAAVIGNLDAGRGRGAGEGRGGRGGRGRGARTWEDRERLEQAREILAGRGPGMRPGEQQALLEEARKLANAEASTSAAAANPRTASPRGARSTRGRGLGRGRAAAAAGRAGGAGAVRGRGRGKKGAKQEVPPPRDESPPPVWGCGSDSAEEEPGSEEDMVKQLHSTDSDTDVYQPAKGRRMQSVQQEERRQQQQQQQQQAQPPAGEPAPCPLLQDVHFHALDSQDNFVLWRLRPSYIVMYDPDLGFVRQVEVYKAERPKSFLKVYHCYYAASLERDAFIAGVEREASVFAELIRAKQHLVLPLDMDAGGQMVPVAAQAGPSHADLWLDTYSLNALTRVAGGRGVARALPRRLVVDVREFRSSLPAVLHQQGFLLAPMTLEVGDYVLSPELVLERKSVPDLMQSLASGRLFHQAEAMTKAYKTPILLIEFDGDQAFMLQAPGEIGADIDPRNVMSRLVLLLLHFPKLRLIWSRSLHATGDIFLSIKRQQDEPDPAAAAIAGLPLGPDGLPLTNTSSEAVVNQSAMELLRRLPGVTDANYRGLMEGVGSLRGLADASLEQLQALMGGERAARMLHEFLQAPCPAAAP